MSVKRQNLQLVADYRACFSSPAGQRVLTDLMRFSGFRRPLDDDLAVAEGKRRTFLRIVEMTQLNDGQLLALYGGGHVNLTGADG